MKDQKCYVFEIKVSDTVTLQLMDRCHAKEMFAVVQKNREFLKQWLNWPKCVKNEKDSLDKILDDQKKFGENTALELGIFKNGKFIGRIGFHWIKDVQAEIGYWLDQSANGSGIMTESCKVLIKYAFQETNIHRIIIRMDVENISSKKIPERLGFTCEGIERESILLKGKFRNTYVYSLLKTDPVAF